MKTKTTGKNIGYTMYSWSNVEKTKEGCILRWSSELDEHKTYSSESEAYDEMRQYAAIKLKGLTLDRMCSSLSLKRNKKFTLIMGDKSIEVRGNGRTFVFSIHKIVRRIRRP